MLQTEQNYGCQKINLIIHVEKIQKSWILRTVHSKQLIKFF